MFDHGHGPAVVVVQGLHGRWEWTRAALEALAKRCRAISYSLAGDFGSGRPYDPTAGFDNYIGQLSDVLSAKRLERATIVGISFGGFVATHFAALHPERLESLVLASAPGPGWQPNPRQARWLARPWLSTPAFVASSPFRLWPEVRAACGGLTPALAFMARQGGRAAAAPMIPSLMSARIRDARDIDVCADCARITAPTLVITGEQELDRVVPVETTRRYASMINGARYELMNATGHLGVLTQPERFATLVSEFVHANRH
jgi:2-hydroxy-6-oxonona-2,4-dienedioate hydrolase